jgi:RNase P subunit RPR2
MAAEPITYMAIKYPAPICERCGQTMLTITTVHRRLTTEPLEVISYRCQRCGWTLGDPRLSGIREHAKRQ